MNSTRPAVSLSEALSMNELERILLLTSNMEYNHGNVTWGGSWAGHSITCLLQDILEGMTVKLVNSTVYIFDFFCFHFCDISASAVF